MKEIFVIDTETTGLNSFPSDFILEIGIVKVDLEKREAKRVFSSCINWFSLVKNKSEYKQLERKINSSWIIENSSLTLQDIKKSPGVNEIVQHVSKILDNKIVTSYNTQFDFWKFLNKDPWKLDEIYKELFPCLMLKATPVCKLPGYYDEYKYPTLQQAFDMLVRERIPKDLELHRALSDTWLASQVLLALYPEHYPGIRGW